jgi:Zn-finger nucleic acid-binding protein
MALFTGQRDLSLPLLTQIYQADVEYRPFIGSDLDTIVARFERLPKSLGISSSFAGSFSESSLLRDGEPRFTKPDDYINAVRDVENYLERLALLCGHVKIVMEWVRVRDIPIPNGKHTFADSPFHASPMCESLEWINSHLKQTAPQVIPFFSTFPDRLENSLGDLLACQDGRVSGGNLYPTLSASLDNSDMIDRFGFRILGELLDALRRDTLRLCPVCDSVFLHRGRELEKKCSKRCADKVASRKNYEKRTIEKSYDSLENHKEKL